jgi:glyoxylase-like metal-dependent hydrolase (beta-lactamase superfamily II)
VHDLHVDHVGWNTRLENGRWVPTFPNARYVLSRTEYEVAKKEASGPNSRSLFTQVFEDSIHPVVEAGKACLVDGIHELIDQLTLRPAPGHSPGHFRIELRSQGAVGVFAGDILHSPIQVPFWEWSTGCAGTGEWRRFRGASFLSFVPPRTRFCCPATSKRRTSGGSNEREGRSPSTSDGSLPVSAPLKGTSAAH